MAEGTKFPAKHLSAFDVGRRVTVTTIHGAKITDKLTGISTRYSPGPQGGIPTRTVLCVTFENVGRDPYDGYLGYEVDLESWVKRHDDGE